MNSSWVWPALALGLVGLLSSCKDSGRGAVRLSAGDDGWPGHFVDAPWVAGRPGQLRLIDIRARQDYEDGHLAGAINLPLSVWQDGAPGREDRMVPMGRFEEMLSEAGLLPADRVVVYGEAGRHEAYRVAWILGAYGHKRVAVMVDGISGWIGSGRPLVSQPASLPRTVYRARLRPERVANRLSVHHAIYDPNAVLLDVRQGASAYSGRSDRIPNALAFDLGEGLMNPAELGQVREMQGTLRGFMRGGSRFVVYSDTALRSALVSLALIDLGARVELYDGGWDEWASHLNYRREVTNLPRQPSSPPDPPS